MGELTHFNASGEAHMVDVGDKERTRRTAVATGKIFVNQAVFEAVEQGTAKKGTCWLWPASAAFRRQSAPLS